MSSRGRWLAPDAVGPVGFRAVQCLLAVAGDGSFRLRCGPDAARADREAMHPNGPTTTTSKPSPLTSLLITLPSCWQRSGQPSRTPIPVLLGGESVAGSRDKERACPAHARPHRVRTQRQELATGPDACTPSALRSSQRSSPDGGRPRYDGGSQREISVDMSGGGWLVASREGCAYESIGALDRGRGQVGIGTPRSSSSVRASS
jgi:hypothetical protein